MVIMITLEKVKEVLSPEQYETFLSVIVRTYSYVTLHCVGKTTGQTGSKKTTGGGK